MIRLLIICLLLTLQGYSQSADFISLKKNSRTVKSYYAGSQIEFVSASGAYRNAMIERIANDTLHLREYIVSRVPTQLGFYIIDTLGSYHYAYHYRDIARFGKKQTGFNIQGSGYALLGGGILLTVASGVVYLVDRSKFSPELMIASAGLGIAGYFLTRVGRKGIVIGKHGYRVEYIRLSAN